MEKSGDGFPPDARRSLRLNAGKLDHLCPLLRICGDEYPEVGRRANEHRAAEVGDPRFHSRIVEARVNLLVELVNDLSGRVSRSANPLPADPLVTCRRSGSRQEGAFGRGP